MAGPNLSDLLWPDASQGRQPQGGHEPRPAIAGCEFLVNGASNSYYGEAIGSSPFGGTRLVSSANAAAPMGTRFTVGNAAYQRLTRSLPLTLITVAQATGSYATGTYHAFLSGTSYGGTTRGGVELGIGGDLGGGAADVGVVYSVIRSDTYKNNETLIKVATAVNSAPILVVQRLTAALQELIVYRLDTYQRVGVASSATIAAPGANNTDSLSIGSTGAGYNDYVMAHARFTRALSDAEIDALVRNPWQLFAPANDSIWIPASAGSGTSITCSVGNATAAGTTATINGATVIACGVGNAGAAGVTSTINAATRIDCAVGNAAAAGVISTINASTKVNATVGNATAAGTTATITLGGAVTIDCAVGNASAAGTTAVINGATRIDASVGNAAAAGVTAGITLSSGITISCAVGNASAAGITSTLKLDIIVTGVVGNATAAGRTCSIELAAPGVITPTATVTAKSVFGATRTNTQIARRLVGTTSTRR